LSSSLAFNFSFSAAFLLLADRGVFCCKISESDALRASATWSSSDGSSAFSLSTSGKADGLKTRFW